MSPRPGRPRCCRRRWQRGEERFSSADAPRVVFSPRLPGLGWPSVPWGPLPTAPGRFSAALWDVVLPHSKQTLSQLDGVAGGSPGLEEPSRQDPELWDAAELNPSRFRTLRGFYGHQVAAFVCLSFSFEAPKTPVLPLQGPRRFLFLGAGGPRLGVLSVTSQ